MYDYYSFGDDCLFSVDCRKHKLKVYGKFNFELEYSVAHQYYYHAHLVHDHVYQLSVHA